VFPYLSQTCRRPDSFDCFWMFLDVSDTSSINLLVMREFVSGPPRYHLAIKGVREQFVVRDQNRVSFVHLRVFTTENEIAVFNVYFLDAQLVHSLKESARLVSCLLFVENKAHMHMLCVHGLKCWRRSPAALSLCSSFGFIVLVYLNKICHRQEFFVTGS